MNKHYVRVEVESSLETIEVTQVISKNLDDLSATLHVLEISVEQYYRDDD